MSLEFSEQRDPLTEKIIGSLNLCALCVSVSLWQTIKSLDRHGEAGQGAKDEEE